MVEEVDMGEKERERLSKGGRGFLKFLEGALRDLDLKDLRRK